MTVNKVIQIPFMGSILQQQTDGGLIDISAIVDMVNAKRLRQGKTEIEVADYFENGNSQEYLQTLLTKFNLKANRGIPVTANSEQNQQVTIIEEDMFTTAASVINKIQSLKTA